MTANDLNRLSRVNGAAWQYDAERNLINDGRYQYQWDAANRLVGIMDSTTGTVTSFAYDGLGRRRVIGQSDASGNHTETRYLWCGDEVCGTRNTSGQVLADYFAQGEQHDNYTVSGTRETANSYYLRDQIGSVIGVMNATGTLLGSSDYTSYGMTRSASGQQTDIGYAGMLRGPAGLYLTKYRAYNPAAGRWLSRDPIGMAGGENVYAYVGGDPISFVDTLGLAYYDKTWGWDDYLFAPTFWARQELGMDPSMPQPIVNYSSGLGDGASLGITRLIRDAMGTDDQVDECSTAYKAGGWSSFALGVGRLAYAGLAKAGAAAAASGAEASAFRSALRRAFGGGDSFRPPDLSRYATDDALRAAAGRTNLFGNALGAGAAAAGAYAGSGCGCH